MKIGIIGSGNIGGALGRAWSAAGHEVMFASRHPDELDNIARQARGARTGKVEDAIEFGDVLLEAIPFAAAMKLPSERLTGRILISASNYYPQRDGNIELAGRTQTEALGVRLPGTRIVKAFNMMFAEEMARRADGETDEPLAILYAGEDEEAKRTAAGLIEEARFAPVDAGGLADSWVFQSGGPLYAQRMSAEEARRRLDEALAAGPSGD